MSRYFAAFLTLALVFLAGCGGGNDPDTLIANANRENVQRLANLYNGYQARNGWAGPRDKETFLNYIKSLHERKLARMGIALAEIEELFVSPRDNEEFKIRYGIVGGMGASAPVVFEVTGVDGMRNIGFTGMRMEEADAERYDLLWSGKGDNAAATREVAPSP